MMGAGNKLTTGTDKAKQIKKMKKLWIAGDVSQELEKNCQDELDWFDEWFPDEKQCKQQLLYWLGWKLSRTDAVFVCPKCGEINARVSPNKKERKNKRLVFRCRNTKCKDTPSPKSVTIMARSQTPYRFWYLCIYVIGLMNGQVPWAYLNRKRVNFKSGKKKKTIQMRDISNIIYTILNECSDIDKRMNYCRLVRTKFFEHETCGSYSSWYKSNSWLCWRVAFQRHLFNKNSLNEIITSESYEDGVLSVYRMKGKLAKENDWLLVVRVDHDNNINNIRWMYVSSVEKIDKKKNKSYKNGYRYVAIQTKDHLTEDHPFKLGKKFRKAFKRSYSQKKMSSIDSVSIESPTAATLKKIYDNYRHIKS